MEENTMIAALRSSKPHPGMSDKLRLFGQFVGSWDVEIINYKPEGEERLAGEWHFGWVLDGRVVQDVWIAPKRSGRARSVDDFYEYGTTLRFYDSKIEAWRSTWIGPKKGVVLPFIARQVQDEIVLEGAFEQGVCLRWIFSEITTDSFRWRAVESKDGWATLRKGQEMFARRKPA